jgi:hypothetical protein
MEFVENGSLGQQLASGPLPVSEAVRLTREICSALIDAHGAGVLHCDLKPDNVLLDGQRHARLCDFGQARMSHEQSPALGTLYYMAPEQADLDAPPDARWDVYAVGALLYHMLTGAPPYRTPEMQQTLEAARTLDERLQAYRQAIHKAGRPSGHRKVRGVDARLADIVDRCLAGTPGNRFPNAQAIRDALDARERQRMRRPLLILGVLGPLLLMAALIPIFASALRRNLELTGQQLTTRALESDALSARLQAALLADEVTGRLQHLEAVLQEPELAQELERLLSSNSEDTVREVRAFANAEPASRPRWMQLLDAAWEQANADNLRRQRELDTSWFLNDRRGTQVWRRAFSDRTIGENFAYRDYFHGHGLDYTRDSVPPGIAPLTAPHVSVAYKSTTTGRQTVALSVPVRNRAGEVIGVFSRSAHLGDLQSRLGQDVSGPNQRQVERIIAIAEFRDPGELRLLDHPVLTEEFIRRAESADTDRMLFAKLKVADDEAASVRMQLQPQAMEPREALLTRYHDPVAQLEESQAAKFRGEWMAALSSIPGTGWVVIVQERRDDALQPVQSMANRASRQIWTAVLVAILMMGGMWLFVWWVFARAARTA